MASGKKGRACAAVLLLLFLTPSVSPLGSAPTQLLSDPSIRHHDLFVRIDPDRHALVVRDRLTMLMEAPSAIRLALAPTLQLDRLVLSDAESVLEEAGHEIPFEVQHDPADSVQHITIPAIVVTGRMVAVTAHYHGVINDPPREPRHLRFVTPSETAGHIGPEGLYLSSESRWYLDVPDSLSTYRLRVALPTGWTAVTQGRPRTPQPCPLPLCDETGLTVMEWDLAEPSEALTLVANRFTAKSREWLSPDGQPVQLATYLFPDDAHLADEYLDATARYLHAYIPLLGSYPFDTFAVVENFFPSGLGMPSFTLLGSGVIKRHYVQPYALGHEIVHSWIGNAVFNRTDRGNWVEGLTTYLANYYWHERSGDQQQARDQRQLMLRGYNLHVPPDRDYPVGQFTQKHDERDNAIGYQKSAMVFHLLRQEVGDELYWRSLKEFVSEYRGRRADWRDLERVFAEVSGMDLRWFFGQWIEQSGAPELSVRGVTARPMGSSSGAAFQLTGTILQTGKVFRFLLPLRITMDDGHQQTVHVAANARENLFSATLPAKPATIELDPDAMVIRRVRREALPPVLNHYVSDRRRSVVMAVSDSSEAPHPFQDLVKRITAQESSKSGSERATIIPITPGTLLPQEGSVLILGGPESRVALQTLVNHSCGSHVSFTQEGLTIAGTAYEGRGVAVLANCHRHDQPGSVVSILYAVTPQAAATLARLVFFYGWNSFIVFQDGKPTARGEWETGHERMEVSLESAPVR